MDILPESSMGSTRTTTENFASKLAPLPALVIREKSWETTREGSMLRDVRSGSALPEDELTYKTFKLGGVVPAMDRVGRIPTPTTVIKTSDRTNLTSRWAILLLRRRRHKK
jgi:hypothetical protein